jgi:hypothetical protein
MLKKSVRNSEILQLKAHTAHTGTASTAHQRNRAFSFQLMYLLSMLLLFQLLGSLLLLLLQLLLLPRLLLLLLLLWLLL